MAGLGEYLRGRKRAEFAEAAGISCAYLSQIINGKRSPSLELAIRIERLTDGAVPVESWVDSGEDAA